MATKLKLNQISPTPPPSDEVDAALENIENNYATLNTSQTLTGTKTFQSNIHKSINLNTGIRPVSSAITARYGTLIDYTNSYDDKTLSFIYPVVKYSSDSDWINSISLLAYDITKENSFSTLGIGYNQNGVYTFAPTPATTDNSTKIATTAYVKNNLNSYLPLSGGTMTGTLTFDSNVTHTIKMNTTDGYITILGGSSGNASVGAKLVLCGADYETPGQFTLQAGNSTGYKQLIGKPDGTLTWSGTVPSASTDSTQIATTAYVKDCVPKSVGSATKPVYTNSNGVVTACTYELNKTVPSDAVFTDSKTNMVVSSSNGTFPMLFVPTNNATATISSGQTYFGTGIKANPSTSTIIATTFSGSLSGNASSATAFSAAKAITLTGAVTGTVSSTAGWSVPTIWRSCLVGQSGSSATNPWYKFATIACTTANWDPQITFLVESTYSLFAVGILTAHIRTNGSKVIDTNASKLKWIVNFGFTVADFVLVCPTAASSTAELWVKIGGGYQYRRFTVLSEGTRTDTSIRWTLLNAASAGQAASITTSGTQIVSS